GASARWIDPLRFTGYGNITVIGGLLTGGVSITITDQSFYGYAYVSLRIPDEVPIIGGRELLGAEAAISDKYIGANLKVIGISFGFIYYWSGDFNFGTGINLRGGPMSMQYPEYDSNAVYATNLSKIESQPAPAAYRMRAANPPIQIVSDNVAGQDSLVLEIPFESNEIPTVDDIVVTNPDGKNVPLIADDGNGGGSFLVQVTENGSFIYVSVTDADLIVNGTWTVSVNETSDAEADGEEQDVSTLKLGSVEMYGVEDIPTLESITVTRDADNTSHELTVAWTLNGTSSGAGYLNVYLTKDKELLSKIRSDNTKEHDIIALEQIELAEMADGQTKLNIPDTMESGTYYVVAMLTQNVGGMSTVISETQFTFVNKNLPAPIQSAAVYYGGDGDLYTVVTDAAVDAGKELDYTHYLVEVYEYDANGNHVVVANTMEQFAVGEDIFVGKEANLIAGKQYVVGVKTLRETDDNYFYGTDIVYSEPFTMPKVDKPVLLKVDANIISSDSEKTVTGKDKLEITYTFDRPVWMYTEINHITLCAVDKEEGKENDYFKETWTFSAELPDGDYTVDFVAYGVNKDSATGKDFPNVENAQMGFTVDATAPALSIKQIRLENLDQELTMFASSTVYANADGSFVIEGITDHTAALTANGESVTVNGNGEFTYTGTLNEGETSREILFVAVDAAKNTTKLAVFVTANAASAIERAKIYYNGEPITPDENGLSVINIKNGVSGTLSLVGMTADNKTSVIEAPVWEILSEKGNIKFNQGVFTAIASGETAIKASSPIATVTYEDGTVSNISIEDYVILKIDSGDRDALLEEIIKAEANIDDPKQAEEADIEQYREAIEDAKAVYGNDNAGNAAYQSAANALKTATAAFETAKNRDPIYVPMIYHITVADTENGTVSVSQKAVYEGTSLTITAVPDKNYSVGSVKVNGKDYGARELITIPAVYQNLTVEVTFVRTWDNHFIDVDENDWFYPYVKWAYVNNITQGTSENTFSPDVTLTRAMLVTFLWRAEGCPEAQQKPGFADVPDSMYYSDAVAWAAENGIVYGYSEEQFGPDDIITREQIAVIMHRTAKYRDYEFTKSGKADMTAFDDTESISEFAVDSMEWAVEIGLMIGKDNGLLDPLGNATRAESVTMLSRFYSYIK
nr:S-layer homology domain-containing protein [Clostridia bacterium]